MEIIANSHEGFAGTCSIEQHARRTRSSGGELTWKSTRKQSKFWVREKHLTWNKLGSVVFVLCSDTKWRYGEGENCRGSCIKGCLHFRSHGCTNAPSCPWWKRRLIRSCFLYRIRVIKWCKGIMPKCIGKINVNPLLSTLLAKWCMVFGHPWLSSSWTKLLLFEGAKVRSWKHFSTSSTVSKGTKILYPFSLSNVVWFFKSYFY